MAMDGIKWDAQARVLKYYPETVERLTARFGFEPLGVHLRHLEEIQGLQPDEVVEADGNLLTTAGLNRITNLIIGAGGAALSHGDAVIGVGNSTTAATVADTALGADGNTANAYYQQMDSSYPIQSNGVLTGYCTFGTGNANFAWQEWCWVDLTGTITAGGTLASVGTSPLMMNHKVQSLGTKSSGSIWTIQSSVTLS